MSRRRLRSAPAGDVATPAPSAVPLIRRPRQLVASSLLLAAWILFLAAMAWS